MYNSACFREDTFREAKVLNARSREHGECKFIIDKSSTTQTLAYNMTILLRVLWRWPLHRRYKWDNSSFVLGLQYSKCVDIVYM